MYAISDNVSFFVYDLKSVLNRNKINLDKVLMKVQFN